LHVAFVHLVDNIPLPYIQQTLLMSNYQK
jgi:hypothetical protein